ncbi:hypothetical protein GUITHDRAFT_146298 [Guillardia theta CCMP2712]|uniref:Zn(2)-C6 fungal-type domain-containing protein n=1 Tax=Guillardia theta (strain CCMP2712) TaxID=905079 RepID=L1IHM4_GUITC|nr:hypothetical protein GUITHDRAFT_146298 [Guillardia theta CCMP2712]EKX35743.1 hypothetical protein GUITHDRAFT_146298 [Guillardia theta CCMP2712]|eukprot:XP_005822723.1 hypothetical protein GUITHDRAFT_146298 [Guillardia theta CCMP2712]
MKSMKTLQMSSESDHFQQDFICEETGQKKRRKQVHIACIVCAKAKAACSDTRPCARCVRLAKQDQCVDSADVRARWWSERSSEELAELPTSTKRSRAARSGFGWQDTSFFNSSHYQLPKNAGELPAPPELLVGLVAGVEPTARGWGGRSLMERGYGMPGVVGSLVMQEAVRAGGAAGWYRKEQTRGLELTSGQSVAGWGVGGGILSRATLAGGGRGEMMASWRGEREGQRWQEELRPGAEAGLLSLGMVGRSGWPRGDGEVGEQGLSSEAAERLLRRGMEAIAAGREQETTLRAEMAGGDQPGRIQGVLDNLADEASMLKQNEMSQFKDNGDDSFDVDLSTWPSLPQFSKFLS